MLEIDRSHPAAPELERIENEYMNGLLTEDEAIDQSVAAIRATGDDGRARG